jgi:predicted phage terminase large subunit-like protein
VRRIIAARRSLLGYTEWTKPNYRRAAHLELTARYLEAVECGEVRRLMIFEPPQNGKSELGSIRFPAWAMARRPSRRIITASYGAELAHGFGRATRNCLDSEESREVFPGVSVAGDSKAAALWHTTEGGRLLAVGIGGGVTGHGADILLIDDPVKSREEAESKVYREKVWNWYKAEAYTRLAPDGAIVLTLTRWHDDDLAGRLLAEQEAEGDQWTVLRLPAIADSEADPLGRQPGEALWPARFPLPVLERIRGAIGERDWAALYQQRPAPAEGVIFKWFPRHEQAPPLASIVIGLDTAYTEAERSDYTAWTAWGIGRDRRAYWLDAGRIRGEIPEAERHIGMFYLMMRRRYPGLPVRAVVRKSVAIDRVAAQHLRDDKGVPVIPVRMPAGDMEALANVVAPDFEASRALLPALESPALREWLQEHKDYPAGAHDDYVATTVYALWYAFHNLPAPRRQTPLDLYEGED